MIRRGKDQGWLQSESESFKQWAIDNRVEFSRCVPGTVPGRGGALLARSKISSFEEDGTLLPLMTVPRDLMLGIETVLSHAQVDSELCEVLGSLKEFGRTPRGAILTFLLVQCALLDSQLKDQRHADGSFASYVKSLPCESLPTFWTEAELNLLMGTSLAPAIAAKLKSLQQEYDNLCSSAKTTRWFARIKDGLEFDDWLQVDAMYRSRALDFPGVGHCMVPCIDLANHGPGEETAAIYEIDSKGNATLLLRPGKELMEGAEITITYGDEKGACEMLFSYGFLETERVSAQTIFVDLGNVQTDPHQRMKLHLANCAPGFKLVESTDDGIEWTGDFVWLLCVDQDDGLRLAVTQDTDKPDSSLEAWFKDQKITGGAAQLHLLLQRDALWDVYRLRATTILQDRTFEQMRVLYETQDDMETIQHGNGTMIRDTVFEQAMQLRRLEFELLERAFEHFEKQKLEQVESPVVQSYLAAMQQAE